MTRLMWGVDRKYSEGLDRGVLYLDEGAVPWNGLISVSIDDDSEITPDTHVDGTRSGMTQSIGNFKATVEAVTYPDAFLPYDGYSGILNGQPRKSFGFTYRTFVPGGYEIHFVYNAIAIPSTKTHRTKESNVSLDTFTWDLETKHEEIPWAKPGSHLYLSTVSCYEDVIAPIEDIVYGTEETEARLPSPSELVELVGAYSTLLIRYNGDGSWTATGPASLITVHESGEFEIDASSAKYLNEDTYTINSY